jgi:hypothetical protein
VAQALSNWIGVGPWGWPRSSNVTLSLSIPLAQALSNWIGVGLWGWPRSSSVTLSLSMPVAHTCMGALSVGIGSVGLMGSLGLSER